MSRFSFDGRGDILVAHALRRQECRLAVSLKRFPSAMCIRSWKSKFSLFLLAVTLPVSAADWAHWRGPNRNDVVAEPSGWQGGKWHLSDPVWTANVGAGSTSPLIVGDKLYTLGWQEGRDTVSALDANTGKALWAKSYDCPPHSRVAFGDLGLYAGPNSTPEYDPQTGFLYTLSTDGDLQCWDTSREGRNVWRLNLFDQYHVPRRPKVGRAARHDYSYTSSPLVYGDRLIVEAGAPAGNLIAFDKKTGKQVWLSESKSPAGETGGPVPMTVDGVPCLVVHNFDGLLVVRLDHGHEGQTVATFSWQTEYANNIATPAVQGNSVILTSGYNQSRMARFDISLKAGAKLVWEARAYSKICSPIIHDGHVYWVWRQMQCLDFKTGEVVWKGGQFGDVASLIMTSDDRLIVWANRAHEELLLVDSAVHSADRYVELATHRFKDSNDVYPHVVLANGHLFTKDRTGRITCFQIGGN